MNFISKAKKAAVGVGAGLVDYGQKMKAINMQAEKNLQPKFGASQASDVQMLSAEMRRLKQEQNVSLKNSIRSKLGL